MFRFLKDYFVTGFGFKLVFVLLALIVINFSAGAREVSLQWDPNSEPDLSHYVVHWGVSSGSYSNDSGDIGLVTSYTCSLPDDSEIYYFAVTAVDEAGLSSDYSNEVNTGDILSSDSSIDGNPPTANAGPDQNVNEGSVVFLDGSNSSDPDGDLLSYQWNQLSGTSVILDDSTSVQPMFDSPYITSEGESLTFQLTVADETGLHSTDTCIVNIVSVNNPPTANAGPDQNVNEGSVVYLNGTNSIDPDGDFLTYKWVQISGPAVTISDSTLVQAVFDSPYISSEGESLVFQLTVTDQGGLQSTDSCIVNVVSVNNAPTANAGSDQNVDEGAFVYLDGSGSSDPDGDTLSYQWIQTGGTSVTLSDPASVNPEFEAFFVDPEGESLTFQLTVTDPDGLKSTDTCIVNILWVNNPPVADAGPDQEVDEGSLISLDGSGSSDPDGDSLTFQWIQTVGTAVTLSDPNAGQPSILSSQEIPSGETLIFQLTVTDTGGLKSTDECSVIVVSPSSYDITGDWSSLYPVERKNKSWISGGFNISNFGSQINQSFNVSFYLSDNSSYDSGDTVIYSQVVDSLGEYESVNVTFNSIKVNGGVIGKYIICVIDSNDQIAEEDELNNIVPFLVQ